jgi:hypothetical protein
MSNNLTILFSFGNTRPKGTIRMLESRKNIPVGEYIAAQNKDESLPREQIHLTPLSSLSGREGGQKID